MSHMNRNAYSDFESSSMAELYMLTCCMPKTGMPNVITVHNEHRGLKPAGRAISVAITL